MFVVEHNDDATRIFDVDERDWDENRDGNLEFLEILSLILLVKIVQVAYWLEVKSEIMTRDRVYSTFLFTRLVIIIY